MITAFGDEPSSSYAGLVNAIVSSLPAAHTMDGACVRIGDTQQPLVEKRARMHTPPMARSILLNT